MDDASSDSLPSSDFVPDDDDDVVTDETEGLDDAVDPLDLSDRVVYIVFFITLASMVITLQSCTAFVYDLLNFVDLWRRYYENDAQAHRQIIRLTLDSYPVLWLHLRKSSLLLFIATHRA